MARKEGYEVEVGLRGTMDLLLHKCGWIEEKMKTPDTDYSDEWKRTTYLSKKIMKKGKPVVVMPTINIGAMLVNAGKGGSIGRVSLRKILATVMFREFEVPILYEKEYITLEDIEKNDWILRCPVVVQRRRIIRARTQIPAGWEIFFGLQVFHPRLERKRLREILDKAGQEEGLGDWRPGAPKPGRFGQFEVVVFK